MLKLSQEWWCSKDQNTKWPHTGPVFWKMYLLLPVLLYGLIKCIISLKTLGVSEQNKPKSPKSSSQLVRHSVSWCLSVWGRKSYRLWGVICFSRTIALQYLSITVLQAFLCCLFVVNDPPAKDCHELCSVSVLRHLTEQGLCYTFRASAVTVPVPPHITQELNHSQRQINGKCRTQTRAKGDVREGLITAAVGSKAHE